MHIQDTGSWYNTRLQNKIKVFKLSHATQFTEHINTVMYVQIYINMQCIFWICDRVYVSSSNMMVMIMWSAYSYKKVDIWETLSTSCDCVWAPSIDVTNTESTCLRPAGAVMCSVGLGHGPPAGRNSSVSDVVVGTFSVGTASLWFHVVLQEIPGSKCVSIGVYVCVMCYGALSPRETLIVF